MKTTCGSAIFNCGVMRMAGAKDSNGMYFTLCNGRPSPPNFRTLFAGVRRESSTRSTCCHY